MSKRLDRKFKKQDMFPYVVNMLNLSNEWLLEEVLAEEVFNLLPPKNGETDTEGTLRYIQQVRDGARDVPKEWLYALTCVLSQLVECAIHKGEHVDNIGTPVWNGLLPADDDKLGQLLMLIEVLTVARNIPFYLLEPRQVDSAEE